MITQHAKHPRSATLVLSAFVAILLALGLMTHGAQAYAQMVYNNFVGIKFISVPSGKSFYMGSCQASEYWVSENRRRRFMGWKQLKIPCPSGLVENPYLQEDETPIHPTVIHSRIQVSAYETTVAQFLKFIEQADRQDLLTPSFIASNQFDVHAPVNNVSWHDAQDFAAWLNEKKPRSDQGTYRLPTEAEWEYVARGGTEQEYHFGNSSDELEFYAWFSENSGKRPQVVGRKKPNPWKVYDMYGNLWEWTGDWYQKDYYAQIWPAADVVSNPTGPDVSQTKVVRGCSWRSQPEECRSANRGYEYPGAKSNVIGFRLVRVLN